MPHFDWNRVNLDSFVDRDFNLKKIHDGLLSFESFCILGGRKTGKSTLLRKVEASLPSHFVPVFVDFQTAPPSPTPEWIFSQICRGTGTDMAWDVDFTTSMIALSKSLSERSARLVLLLDEIEAVHDCEWVSSFFDNLNHLLFNNPTTSKSLSLIITGGVLIESTPKQTLCSPLLIRLSVVRLNLLNRVQTREFCLLASSDRIDESFIELVYQETAGHPALLQYYLKAAIAPTESISVPEIAAQLKIDADALCSTVFRSVDSGGLQIYASLIADSGRLPSTPDAIRQFRTHLSRLCYLGLVGRGQDAISLRGPKLFREYQASIPIKAPFDPLEFLRSGKDEDDEFEVKATLCADLWRHFSRGEKAKSAEVFSEVPITIVGFSNSNGGTILIGIAEAKTDEQRAFLSKTPTIGSRFVFGIELDFELLKGTWDEFLGALIGHMKEKIDPTLSQSLEISRLNLCGRQIACIRVSRGTKFYFYDGKFYVRTKNRTQLLTTKDATHYMRENPR